MGIKRQLVGASCSPFLYASAGSLFVLLSWCLCLTWYRRIHQHCRFLSLTARQSVIIPFTASFAQHRKKHGLTHFGDSWTANLLEFNLGPLFPFFMFLICSRVLSHFSFAHFFSASSPAFHCVPCVPDASDTVRA